MTHTPILSLFIGSYQLLTDGHPSLVMDKCSDYWDGTSLQTMSETVLLRSKKDIHVLILFSLDGKEDQ